MQDSENSAGELPAAASGGLPEPPDLFELPPRVRNVLHREPVVYREALLGILRGNDAALAAAAVRLLLALVQSRAVDPELLDVAGAAPLCRACMPGLMSEAEFSHHKPYTQCTT